MDQTAQNQHPDKEDTRLKLMLTAGRLFAEHGFDGVSTRMIADTAGVNLGGIHYHFGSKEKLYVAAFLHASKMETRTCLGSVADEHPELMQTPQGQAEVIRITCLQSFRDFFSPDKPEWQKRLLMRELASPSSAQPILAKEVFQPNLEGDKDFLRCIKPEASEAQMLIWANLLHAQMVFYLMARSPLEMMFGQGFFDPGYFDAAALETARALALLLGLPEPSTSGG